MTRRLAGRVLGRRGHGKLVFLDLADRSGQIQLLCSAERTGPVDLDLGDIVGAVGKPTKTKRGEPSLAVDELVLLAKTARPLPDTYPRPRRRRDPLPQALSRPAGQRGRPPGLRPAQRDRGLDPAQPRRRGLHRGGDAVAAASLRRRLRRTVRHALERARRRPLPAHRHRALPQAAHRRRAREGLRARQGLPERGRLLQAPAGVHDARVVRGVRRLRRHDGAHREARRRRSRGDHRYDRRPPSADTRSTSALRGSG